MYMYTQSGPFQVLMECCCGISNLFVLAMCSQMAVSASLSYNSHVYSLSKVSCKLVWPVQIQISVQVIWIYTGHECMKVGFAAEWSTSISLFSPLMIPDSISLLTSSIFKHSPFNSLYHMWASFLIHVFRWTFLILHHSIPSLWDLVPKFISFILFESLLVDYICWYAHMQNALW